MAFFDKITDFIHESSLASTSYNDPMYKQLKGFTAVDKNLDGYSGYRGNDPQDQVNRKTEQTKNIRDILFNKVDTIKNHHIATSIKNSIIGDCFHALCDKRFVNIQYRCEDDKINEMFNKDIEILLRKTYFLEVFKSCLINDGMDYGELFLSTECKVGEGIVAIGDDVNVNKHLAIYKNLSPIGFIKFNSRNNKITIENKIDSSKMSHFIVNPQKIPIEIIYDTDVEVELPEKIMCAVPLLTPVVDLIIQYNALEYVSTGVEISKALAPTILGVGVSPNSDMTEITRQLQQYSIALNSTRNNVINNLENIDAKAISKEIGKIQLVPYSIEEGTNSMKQITVDKSENNLHEKLNDITNTIEKAMCLPDGYLSTSTMKGRKEENISMNPRYSRMLSGIQQSLSRGIGDFIYKHLEYKYSKTDKKGKVFIERDIDRNFIEVKFQSITNIDNRLDMEQMMLTAETMGNIAGVIDVIAGSPNLPVKTRADNFIKLWKNMTEAIPALRDCLEIDLMLEENNNIDPEDYEDSGEGEEENPNLNSEIKKDKTKDNTDQEDIKDIFQ